MVIGLIFVLAYGLRRSGLVSMQKSSQLKILASLSVGAREKLILIQVGDQQLLIGVTPHRVQTLYQLEQPLNFTEKNRSTQSFAMQLKAQLQKVDKDGDVKPTKQGETHGE